MFARLPRPTSGVDDVDRAVRRRHARGGALDAAIDDRRWRGRRPSRSIPNVTTRPRNARDARGDRGRRRHWRPAASTASAPSRISAFASAMASSDAKKPEMRLADVRPHPDVRLGDAHQRADLAGVIHPQFDDRNLRPLPQLDQRQRQPDVVVEVPAVADHPVARREKLRRHFLRRGLARAAGDRHDLRARLRAGPRAPAPAAPRSCRRPRSRPASAARAARASRKSSARPPPARRRRRAGVDRRRRELRAVEPLAADRRRTARRPQRPRVDRHACELTRGVAGRDRAADRRGHPLPRSGRRTRRAGPHRRVITRRPSCVRRRASASRATATSSNGSTAVADHLVLLVALAGDQHEVAGPRQLDRLARSPRARSTIVSRSAGALSRRRVGRDAALNLLDDPRPDPRCAGCPT